MPDSMMDTLNEFIRNDPTLRDVFGYSSSPSYRYWSIKKGTAHNRYRRDYAYATQKARGPGGQPVGFYAMIYEHHPENHTIRLVKSLRFRRRKSAKARAYRWYATAMGYPEEKRVLHPGPRRPTNADFDRAVAEARAENPDPVLPTPPNSPVFGPTEGPL